MDKYINLVLDLPATLNQKLPKNNFNQVMDDSEKSVKDWVGLVYKIFALVFLVTMLYAVLKSGAEYLGGDASGLAKAGSVLSILVFLYASFPLAQIIRNAGDGLAASKSGIVDFVFKDVVVANIRARSFSSRTEDKGIQLSRSARIVVEYVFFQCHIHCLQCVQ